MMSPQIRDSKQEAEIHRLMALLPEEMRSQVVLEPTQAEKPDLVTTQSIRRQQFSLQIDFEDWLRFAPDQRNLLFWHEVARIQGRSIPSSSWSTVVLGIGTVALLAELFSQNLVGVITTLAAMGLGGYRLYQQHWGERFLREMATADQGALLLAHQFGYRNAQAYDSLYSALKLLARNKSRKAGWKQYQVRLRVLEIMVPETVSENKLLFSQTRPTFTADLPYQVSSLCS
jgi:Protein of unknown function (DUF3318)